MEALPVQGVFGEEPENKHLIHCPLPPSPAEVLTGCTQPEARLLWGSVLEFHQSSVLGQRSRCTRGETDPEEQTEGSGPSIHSVLLGEKLPSPAEATCQVPPAVLMQGDVRLLRISPGSLHW